MWAAATYAATLVAAPLGASAGLLDYVGQCVPFARAASGIQIYGDAWTWWDQAGGKYDRGHDPRVGSVIVMHGEGGGLRGHVAVVRRIINEREIVVDHANWHNQGEITIDAPVKDVSPGNDWSQVKVWWTKGQHWGRRTYAVQGFILPYQTLASAGS